jgi:hypothetical protein
VRSPQDDVAAAGGDGFVADLLEPVTAVEDEPGVDAGEGVVGASHAT